MNSQILIKRIILVAALLICTLDYVSVVNAQDSMTFSADSITVITTDTISGQKVNNDSTNMAKVNATKFNTAKIDADTVNMAKVKMAKINTDTVSSATASVTKTEPAKADSAKSEPKLIGTLTKVPWSISFSKILTALIIFFIALFVLKFITKLLESIAEKSSRMRLSIKRTIPIIRIFGWIFVLYIIIKGIFAPPIETLIAFTGAAGIAVGFASQDILKNIFGGIMILFDRPFQVGDKIQVGSYYGEVISIGLRTVRLVTPDDSLVSVPNSEIVNQSVSNSNSGEFNCQVVAEFYLPADVDISQTRQIAYEAAAVSRFIYMNKPIAIIIKNEIHEGRSLLKLRLKAYVLDIRYEFPFMSEMTEIVMRELLANKVVEPEDLAIRHSL